MAQNNMAFTNSVGEAMELIKTKFGYLTQVTNELQTIEQTLLNKQVVTVEGLTVFVDELHLLD
jgi:plastocyanin domain-containing protein